MTSTRPQRHIPLGKHGSICRELELNECSTNQTVTYKVVIKRKVSVFLCLQDNNRLTASTAVTRKTHENVHTQVQQQQQQQFYLHFT